MFFFLLFKQPCVEGINVEREGEKKATLSPSTIFLSFVYAELTGSKLQIYHPRNALITCVLL